jgi:hypothetical protein
VTWTSQTVPSLLEEMLAGAFFATAMDRNFFAGTEKGRRKVVGEKDKAKEADGLGGGDGERRKARWVGPRKVGLIQDALLERTT